MEKYPRIAIVHGGTSSEHNASTLNASYVEQSLTRRGYKTFLVDYNFSMIERLSAAAPDLVWVCVQGKGHGDGTVQSVLDFMKLNYTGSGALGAHIINDKILCKELFAAAGVRTPAWQTLSYAAYKAGNFDFSGLGYPVVAKAPSEGASYGIELILSHKDISKIEKVFAYEDPILIEKYIPGHAVTAGLLVRNGKLNVFPVVGIRKDREEDRYEIIKADNPGAVVRFDFTPDVNADIEKSARKIFDITRSRDYARVDFMVSMDDGLPYALEINAVPGLHPYSGSDLPSFFPLGALEAGIEYDDLLEIIVTTAAARSVTCGDIRNLYV
ncbi:MAG: hypothetical protein LBG72_02780 [Spirochaetaceae bacterium]|jgi:D-alanine-D-alanine ligase/UDP-N-acetylmuramate--alanine ligase|nr:hypothetical protein [Spirochaetaceae bacterium]